MRVYSLRLTEDDFTPSGSSFRSATIDLYNNSVYRNYSITKSNYGLNSLGNDTWTGLRQIDGSTTDTGLLTGGRYIDTSGRIDIISWSAEGGGGPRLTVYTADEEDAVFPEEFVAQGGDPPAYELNIYGSPRWARLEVAFDDPQTTEFVIYIRIMIDRPVMAPLYRKTRALLNQFPEWMAIRELSTVNPATPSMATPASLGGAYLNAVAGEWLEDLANSITYTDLQSFITSADLNTVAWVYRAVQLGATPSFDQYMWSILGDGVQLARAIDLEEFYDGLSEDVCIWDEQEDAVYTTKLYDELSINGEVLLQEPFHIWNVFDDFGLLVDLRRHHLEGNESYRSRILDVHINRLGVGVENFKLALRRELNIWFSYGATPDSKYVGATPEVLEISDLEQDPYYVADDGMPTGRFTQLAEHLAKTYPSTWGFFRWDKARWDMGGPNHEGYGILPYRLDATPLSAADVQAGVGDGNDLLLLRPDAPTGPHEFTAYLKMRGRHRTIQNEYPPVELEFDIYGESDRKFYDNPEEAVWLTVEADAGGVTYFHSFLLKSTSDVDIDRPTPTAASFATFQFFDADASGTDDALVFSDKITDADYPGVIPGKIPLEQITSIRLRAGSWNVGSQTYGLTEGSNTFDAWFSHDPGTVLTYNAGTPTMTPPFPLSNVVMKSKTTAFTVGRWRSEPVPYRVRLNDVAPYDANNVLTVPLAPLIWDPYQEGTPNRQLVLQLKTQDQDGNYGAYTVDEAGVPLFIGQANLEVGGLSTWTDGKFNTISPAAVSIALSVDPYVDYPLDATVWTLFEATATSPINGVVDENGPWRNALPASPGNTNFALQSIETDRDAFGIPDTVDYVVTWMGVEADDPRVIAWLDSNTVKPATPDAADIVYPADAIEEVFSGGEYSYEPFVLRVRLRSGPDPRWNPYLHSGWYYQGLREGYVFADPATQTTTTKTTVLNGVARQGAPIIAWTNEATPRELRQVAFADMSAATPVLGLVNTETVRGTGTTKLYLSYVNVYNATVTDVTTDTSFPANSTTTTNELTTAGATDRERMYEVQYQVALSFIADHEYIHTDGSQRTRLVFDRAPATLGVASYKVTYESSRFDPATPVDLPLNPLYTSVSEGFVFLSHDEYNLARVEVSISPSKVIANGSDYAVIALRSLDEFGNPKAGQSLTLATNFGTLSNTVLTTDQDGFATVVLTAGSSGTGTKTITITGAANATATFQVDPAEVETARLLAVPAAEQIPADGHTQNLVYGRLEDDNYQPIAGATINWKRARSLYELFTVTPAPATPADYSGSVVTDYRGAFTVGPLTAQSPDKTGYWYMKLERSDGSVGDVVFWHEYPDILYGAQPYTGLPRPAVQEATPTYAYTPYADANQFPSYYDEATPYAPATPVYGTAHLHWLPPKWFALPKYLQYQLGLFGANRGAAIPGVDAHKYRKAL